MASIERTAYPRFKRSPTPQHLHALYTPTNDELTFAQKTARSLTSQLSLLVLLKSFQQLGYFPKISDVPIAIVSHLRNCLSLIPAIEPGYEETRTLYRHHQAIRDYLRVTSWNTGASRLAIKAVSEAAETKDNPADLINVALETLIKERYELPAFSTLDRLVRRVRTVVNQRYFEEIFNRLSPEETARLDALLIMEGRGSRSPYQRLKHLPKSPTLTHLQEWITQFEWLESHGKIDHLLAGLPPLKLKHFAAEAWALDAAEMKDFAPSKRYTLLLCLIHRTRVLRNASEIQPEKVHADTQGQSEPVFALAHLLGIKLMPRIRNWKDLIFYRPDKGTKYQHIDALFTDHFDWKLIETHLATNRGRIGYIRRSVNWGESCARSSCCSTCPIRRCGNRSRR
jgi:Domain of unknown function (DUF4158)/Tn3 transposase DDE domain